MHTFARRSEYTLRVESLRRMPIVRMELHARRKSGALKLVPERHSLDRAGAVVKVEFGPRRMQALGHRKNWCDLDATCEKQALPGLHEAEVIPGCADPKPVADPDAIMKGGRASARLRLPQYGNAPLAIYCWIVTKRVLPNESGRHVNIDVCAGRERRERSARRIDQLETGDAIGLLDTSADLNEEFAQCVGTLAIKCGACDTRTPASTTSTHQRIGENAVGSRILFSIEASIGLIR